MAAAAGLTSQGAEVQSYIAIYGSNSIMEQSDCNLSRQASAVSSTARLLMTFELEPYN
jgi:hypothetical protein